MAKVIPLHKKGDKKSLKSYRPVSLLPVPVMILEKVVACQIEEFFEQNKLLGSFQFGFQKNKSTISELLTLFDTLVLVLVVRMVRTEPYNASVPSLGFSCSSKGNAPLQPSHAGDREGSYGQFNPNTT